MNKPSETTVERIHMQGVHLELTAALQQAIRDKFAALLRHNDRIVRINVRLHHEAAKGSRPLYTATGHVEIGGPDLVANVKGDDAYSLIDALVEKLEAQLSERHERRTDRGRGEKSLSRLAGGATE